MFTGDVFVWIHRTLKLHTCLSQEVWLLMSNIMLFCLQGLSDVEEFVIYKTLRALAALTELNLIQKPILQELINEVVPFLSHPVSE